MSEPDLFLARVLKDRYQLQRQLSKKAGRRTLLATDRETQQPVILKVLTFSQDLAWEEVRLFQREAELLQTLSHPSIPKYIDAFEFGTTASKGYVLAQSYIDAPSLENHLNAGRCFTEDDVRHILESVLKILIYLHTRQPPVIHRDIKLSNILLTDRSGNSPGQVYLVDFGSVQTLASRAGKTITVVGSYGYMPPEQFGDVACPASDLYSLGVTAIAILTQTHPADLPKAELRIQFKDKVSLQPSFQHWLQQMTAPEIADRPDSAEAALRSLRFPQLPPTSSSKTNNAKFPMTPTQLLKDAVWQSVSSGAKLGAICTSIFPGVFLILNPLAILLIALVGGVFGVFLGAINGILIGILTRLFYFPFKRSQTHRAICVRASIAVGLTASILGSFMALTTASNGHVAAYAAILVPAIVLTGGLMGNTSYKIISRWYQQPSAPLSSQDR